MAFSLLLVVVGLVLLFLGGEALLRGAVGIAALFRLTPAVIGLTVVAAGTSIPELAVSVAACWAGSPDITVGNVVGSNIFNVLVILGVCALIRPLVPGGNTIRLEYPVLALITLMYTSMASDGRIDRFEGFVMLCFYVGFMIYLVGLVRDNLSTNETVELAGEVGELGNADGSPRSTRLCLLYVTLGTLLLAGGAHSIVTGAVGLARLLGWSERVIGLTVVAIGTGLPEVVTSVVSSWRGRDDLAFGNVIGSNLFNTLVILGLSALCAPLPVSAGTVHDDNVWNLGITLALLPLLFARLPLGRVVGATLLAVYAGLLTRLLMLPG